MEDTVRSFSEICRIRHLSNAQLASITEYIYKSTHEQDRGLRDIMLRAMTTKVASLLQDDDFCRMAIDIPRFGFELLAQTVKRIQQMKLYYYRIND